MPTLNGVAELREGVVAHEERPLAQVALARDREVPGQVERLALDARPLERAEDALHVRPPRVDGGVGAGAGG